MKVNHDDEDDGGDDNQVYCLSRKIIIACVQCMKCNNPLIDSCPVLYFSIISLSSLLLVCLQHASVCEPLSCGLGLHSIGKIGDMR